jgi:HAD superfamily hydrolase (TIGR01450 family)
VLGDSRDALVEGYDLVMFDLDGVVYIESAAVPGAPEQLARLRGGDTRVAFITNNASRPPEAVAEKLTGLGVEARPDEVVTSAQAAAHLLVERHGGDSVIACLGADGLQQALREVGLRPAAVDDDRAAALVTGYGPDVVWRDVMRAAVRVRDGLPWVASNTDRSLPTRFGPAPGHGVMVDMLERFSGVKAVVAGKPQRPLLDEAIRRLGGRRPLMVGDRLDTDIEGANNIGIDSLLVMTGVTGLPELAAAGPELRPTYVSVGLDGMFVAHPAPERDDSGWSCGGWRAAVEGDRLQVSGDGMPDDWWRVVAAAAWDHLDRSGAPADVSGLAAPAAGQDPAGGNLPA